MLHILIDTREQTPWAFPPEMAQTTRATLRQGDYALAEDESFAIERKSLADFLGTVSTGWERFKRELRRMDNAGSPAKVIIVEGTLTHLFFGQDGRPPIHNHPRLTPQFVAKRLAQLLYDFRSAVLFADSAPIAAALAIALFVRRQKALENED